MVMSPPGPRERGRQADSLEELLQPRGEKLRNSELAHDLGLIPPGLQAHPARGQGRGKGQGPPEDRGPPEHVRRRLGQTPPPNEGLTIADVERQAIIEAVQSGEFEYGHHGIREADLKEHLGII